MWLAERGWDVTASTSRRSRSGRRRSSPERGASRSSGWSPTCSSYEPPPGRSTSSWCSTSSSARRARACAPNAPRASGAGRDLVVLGHDTTNLVDGYGGPRDASVLFTPADVVASLDGLAVERAETVERTVALDDGEAVAIDAFVRAARPTDGEYARAMKTLELTDEELASCSRPCRSYLDDFGHEEADVLRSVKHLLAKLQAPQRLTTKPTWPTALP